MILIWSRERNLCFLDFVDREEILEIIPLIDICAPVVLYLADAVDRFAGFVAFFEEGIDIGDVTAE